VSEPTVVGLRSCANVCEIAASLPVKIKDSYLLINKADHSFTQEVKDGIGRIKIPHAGEIPFDARVIEASEKGLSLQTIPDTSAAAAAVKKMLQRVGVL
jgi:MinD superfamily P-loop ATPase